MYQYNSTSKKNELYHYGVLGMKWGIRRARKSAAKAKEARARGDSEAYKKYDAKSKKILNKHKLRAGEKAFKRIDSTPTSRLAVQSLVFGTYGTLKYHQMRAKNQDRTKSFLHAMGNGVINGYTGGLLSIVEPRLSAIDRKESKRKD